MCVGESTFVTAVFTVGELVAVAEGLYRVYVLCGG